MASVDCRQHINSLPNEILQEVFTYLRLEDRKTAALVCRLWEQEAFCTRLLANVQLRTYRSNYPIILKVLRNSMRKYRNVRVCDINRNEDTFFKFIVAVLDIFGTTIEGFTSNGYCTIAQIKAFADRMPNLKRMTIHVRNSETHQNEPCELPVLDMLHDVNVTFSEEDLDMLRMAPNAQRLSIKNYHENIRVFEVLEHHAYQLRSLDLYIRDMYSIDNLRFENLEVLRLHTLFSELEEHRLHNLFQGLRELKTLHLCFSISDSTLAVICSSCPKLDTLEITAKDLAADSFKYLNELSNLEFFIVTDLHMRLLEQSDPINAIEELCFEANYVENVEFVDKLNKVFPNVSSMKIINQQPEGCAIFRHICRKFNHLTRLAIIGHPLIATIEKYNPLDNLGNVEELHFIETSSFGIPTSPNRVKFLILENVNISKFVCINRSFPHLKLLEVRSRRKISPKNIRMIRRKFPNCVIDYVVTFE